MIIVPKFSEWLGIEWILHNKSGMKQISWAKEMWIMWQEMDGANTYLIEQTEDHSRII